MRKLAVAVFLAVLASVLATAQPTLAQSAPTPFKIVHLGDSYSAGNGARAADGSRNYISVAECYRSPTNWGSQYAASLRATRVVTYVNRACSGGVIADLTEERRFKNAISVPGCPSSEYPSEEFWVRSTDGLIDRCQRRLRPQIDAVDESTDLVLLTIGGNDAEFAGIVEQCFAVGYRDPGDCREAVDFANQRLPAIELDLFRALRELRERMRPDARVALVTYPHLLPDVGYRLRSLSGSDSYNAGDRIREVSEAGERRQRLAVQRANSAAGEEYVILVDGTKSLFEGRLPNPDTTARNPNRWLHEFETRVPAEFYHFNPSGHQAIARMLTTYGTFGVQGSTPTRTADVDLVFVVDTTGSMASEIGQVRRDMAGIVEQLRVSTNSYRVGIVSYRDFPERTGETVDYPSRIDLGFTSDVDAIQQGINRLSADGGGDIPETVFSGLSTALGFDWRAGVTKLTIVIGDAPALSPEPISELTEADLIAQSLAIDPVQFTALDVSELDDGGSLSRLAEATGGSVETARVDLVQTIEAVLTDTVQRPFAWMGEAYSAGIGEAVNFDASGSFDPSGDPLTRFEWDFNGDSEYELTSTTPQVSHVYSAPFAGVAVVRVTGAGGTALASARVNVSNLGFADQGDQAACETDSSGASIIVDEGGAAPCTATSLPVADSGVEASSSAGDPQDGSNDDPVILPPGDRYRCKGRVATIVGTSGPDRLVGTTGDDVIVGLEGSDRIRGRGGNDLICAGSGADIVRAGTGADRVFGQRGVDRLFGQPGNDRLVGNAGADRLIGGSGRDRCLGGTGPDVLRGCERRR